MSMNIQLDGDDQALNSTINTTPLVDVMLVLLIIFLITVPVINKTVHVNLPDAANIPTQTKPENIVIAVTANGDMYWNNGPLANVQELIDKVKSKATVVPQPEIHIRMVSPASWFLNNSGMMPLAIFSNASHSRKNVITESADRRAAPVLPRRRRSSPCNIRSGRRLSGRSHGTSGYRRSEGGIK